MRLWVGSKTDFVRRDGRKRRKGKVVEVYGIYLAEVD